ncbi:ACT domain-containing protein, partial [Enterococcus faecalis]
VTADSSMALAKEKINLEMINQASSQVSNLFGIKKEQEEKAIKALFRTFFHD